MGHSEGTTPDLKEKTLLLLLWFYSWFLLALPLPAGRGIPPRNCDRWIQTIMKLNWNWIEPFQVCFKFLWLIFLEGIIFVHRLIVYKSSNKNRKKGHFCSFYDKMWHESGPNSIGLVGRVLLCFTIFLLYKNGIVFTSSHCSFGILEKVGFKKWH